MGEGQSTPDLFGKTFVLLRFGAQAPSGRGLIDAARPTGVQLTMHLIENDEAARLYETALVLVRPDARVCWRGHVEAADASEIIDVVRGAHAAVGREREAAYRERRKEFELNVHQRRGGRHAAGNIERDGRAGS
ncbi:hypothetical protein KNO81_23200 [Paraburkholderia sediminicola]|nr:hypothetical protein [Paraburkholderia sediminicola]